MRDHPLLAHTHAGEGAPVVLLHAFPLDGRMWEPQLKGLSDRGLIIAPDLSGFGRSLTPNPPVMVEDHAYDIAHLLDALHLERVTLVGLSMGGYIALAFARRYPQRLRALVLANTKATPDTPDQKRARDENIALVESDGVSALASKIIPKLLSQKSPTALIAQVRALADGQSADATCRALEAMRDRLDASEVLRSLDMPVHLIASSEDAIIAPDIMKTMCGPDVGWKLIEGAGHLSNLDAPEAFNNAIISVLEDSAH